MRMDVVHFMERMYHFIRQQDQQMYHHAVDRGVEVTLALDILVCSNMFHVYMC